VLKVKTPLGVAVFPWLFRANVLPPGIGPKAIAERHRSRREALAELSGNISPQIYKGAEGSTGERDWIPVLIGSQNRNRQRTR
jgi:hypothetical protein